MRAVLPMTLLILLACSCQSAKSPFQNDLITLIYTPQATRIASDGKVVTPLCDDFVNGGMGKVNDEIASRIGRDLMSRVEIRLSYRAGSTPYLVAKLPVKDVAQFERKMAPYIGIDKGVLHSRKIYARYYNAERAEKHARHDIAIQKYRLFVHMGEIKASSKVPKTYKGLARKLPGNPSPQAHIYAKTYNDLMLSHLKQIGWTP